MNFIQKLTTAFSRPPQSELGGLSVDSLMKPYENFHPGQVRQLPDVKVPTITRPVLATQQEAARMKQQAEIFQKKVDAGLQVLKAAGQMKQDAAKLVAGYGQYTEACMQAEKSKQDANVSLGKQATQLAQGYNQQALALGSSIDQARLNIDLAVQGYKEIAGF